MKVEKVVKVVVVTVILIIGVLCLHHAITYPVY